MRPSEAHPALGQPDSEADKMPLNDAEIERYARQVVMPEIGEEGQKKLLSAHVLILGAGGLGAPVIAGLAGAGIGHLTIIDDDEADITNLNRQFINTMQRLSQPKTESAEQFVKGLNPDVRLSCHIARFTEENAKMLIEPCDLVIDCTDNPHTRYLANQLDVAASTLNRILKQQSGISPEMALRLSKALGRSPESWLAMQHTYDLWQAKRVVQLDRVNKLDLDAA